MSDERLEAGRHHLRNGNRAVQLGYPVEARSFFESALLQFRGPELRVGEAHAFRGLAQVALSEGDAAEAEGFARRAIAGYEELARLLDAIDDAGAVAEIRSDAMQGEAAARVVLAEVLTRTGRPAAARATLDEARDLIGQQRDSVAAGAVWLALGRLSLRSGHGAEARRWFDKALDTHRVAQDLEGQIAALLLIADQERVEGALDAAEGALHQARDLARELDDARWFGRILLGLGALCHQAGRYLEARSYYEDAVARTRDAGEPDRHGAALVGLGGALGELGEPGALGHLVDGIRALSSTEHTAALAAALYQLASYARRRGEPLLALAAAEGARRAWAATDGSRGQVLALRHVVKAFSALRCGRGALAAALAREALCHEPAGNARDVAEWFRARAPADMLASLADLDVDRLCVEVKREVERAIAPALVDSDAKVDDLGVPGLAIGVIDAIVAGLPARPAAPAASVTVGPLTPTDLAPTPAAPAERAESPVPARPVEAPRAEDLYASLFGFEDAPAEPRDPEDA